MRAGRQRASRTWQGVHNVLIFDFMFSMGIIGILLQVALTVYADYLFRARLTEAYLAGSALRISLVEQLALSGEYVEVPPSGDSVAAATHETLLGGQGSVEQRKDAGPADKGTRAKDAAARTAPSVGSLVLQFGSGQEERAQAQKDAEAKIREREDQSEQRKSQYVSSAGIVGNAILVAGNIGGRNYEIWTYPAVTDEDTPSVYRWLCGGRVPEGWLAQARATRSDLPDRLQIYDCRARTER